MTCNEPNPRQMHDCAKFQEFFHNDAISWYFVICIIITIPVIGFTNHDPVGGSKIPYHSSTKHIVCPLEVCGAITHTKKSLLLLSVYKSFCYVCNAECSVKIPCVKSSGGCFILS